MQVVDPTDIPRIAKAGIIASMQPTHQTSDRLMAEKRLDPPRLDGAYAWQTIAQSGARLAFGSDFPVESPNPFPGLPPRSAGRIRRPAAGRLAAARARDASSRRSPGSRAARPMPASPRTGSAASSPANGPTSSSSTATRPRSTRRLARTQVLETWVAGKKVWQRAASGGPPSAVDEHRRRSGSAAVPRARPCPARTRGRAARRPGPGFRGSG